MRSNLANMFATLGAAGWIAVTSLVGFLVAVVAYSSYAWNQIPDSVISGAGWTFFTLGIFATVVVGIGLMFLVFYSDRKHYDR